MKQLKMLLLASMVILFTACGGGSSGGTVTIDDPQLVAINTIKAYADDSTNRTPTVLTYKAAGVTGVTDENIDEVNEVVASLTPSDVDTPEKIQKIVDDLGINILPTANAGPDKIVEVNRAVTIIGSGTDIDGMIVSYEWTKGTAVLATTASFDYLPAVVGTDMLTLTVMDDDGGTASDTMNVVVTETPPVNQPPIANAGPDQNVLVSSTVSLDGSGSSDPDGNPLSYSWSFVNKPAGSSATLLNSTAVNPTFIADEAGTYEIQLTVNDGSLNSSDTVMVTAALADGIYFYKKDTFSSTYTEVTLPSICDGITCVKRVSGTYVGVTSVTHGEYKLVAVGQDYTIDNLIATDINGITWAQFNSLSDNQIIRAGSEVEFTLSSGLTNNQEAKLQWSFNINGNPSFMETIYFISNGTVTPPPNNPPVADAGPDQIINTTSTVTLDGLGSSDADSDTLTYSWNITSKPAGSNATLSNQTTVNPTFVADLDGTYVVQLIVNDSTVNSTPATVTVTATTQKPPLAASDFNMSLDVNESTVIGNWKELSSASSEEILSARVITQGNYGIFVVTGDTISYHKAIESNETDVGVLEIFNDNETKQINVTINSLYWKHISAEYYHTVAIKSDGTLWAWGDNKYGKLGDGTTTNRSVPTQEYTKVSDWIAVNTGFFFTVAIKSDGTLWAWGSNSRGQVGDGTTTDRSVPTQEYTESSDWISVDAGGAHTAAIKSDGTLWAWGQNFYGQLGDGTTTDRSVPTQEYTKASDWNSTSAGGDYIVAIKSDNTLWAWGFNKYGQLGDGSTTDRSVPTQEYTESSDWINVSAERAHTVAIKLDNTLWAWGENVHGELGDGTKINRNIPTQEGTEANDWRIVSAGRSHTAAIKSDGTLWAWGYNFFGQLGDGTTTDRLIPTQDNTEANDWHRVSAGGYHTAAIKSDGTLWAWGYNFFGQLGDGTAIDKVVPIQVSPRITE